MSSVIDASGSERGDARLSHLQARAVELADELERRALRFEKVLTERDPAAALAARELAQDFLLFGIELVGASHVTPELAARFAELVMRGVDILPQVFESVVVDALPPSTRAPFSRGQASLEQAAARQRAARVPPLRLERVERDANTIPARAYSDTSLPTLRPEEHAAARSGLRLLWNGAKHPDDETAPPEVVNVDDDDVSLEISFAEIGPEDTHESGLPPPRIKSA